MVPGTKRTIDGKILHKKEEELYTKSLGIEPMYKERVQALYSKLYK